MWMDRFRKLDQPSEFDLGRMSERSRVLAAFFVAATFTLIYPVHAADQPDICDKKTPAPLKQVLTAKFPGFRLARVSDQDRDAMKASKKAGGDGCLTVTQGDFDGDGNQDVALLLTKTTGNGKTDSVRLIAALRRAGAWSVYRLPTWCRTISSCYVQTEKPGVFKRTEALDGPLSSMD
jgi:hypothetical protein